MHLGLSRGAQRHRVTPLHPTLQPEGSERSLTRPKEHQEKIHILLARHGETPDNVDVGEVYIDLFGQRHVSRGFVISGHNDVLLTARGAKQCVDGGGRLVEYLLPQGRRHSELSVLCSDLPRAVQTEGFFATGMGDFASPGSEPTYTSALRERHAGRLEGWLRQDAIDRDEGVLDAFTDHTYRYPGGESLADCGTRAGEFIVSHVREHGKPVLAFAHEITILGALDYLANGQVTEGAWRFKGQVPNAGFFDVLFDPATERGEVIYYTARQ